MGHGNLRRISGEAMTHDELLEKVNIRAAWQEKRSDGTTILVIDYDDAPNTKALRAVVELHKPYPSKPHKPDGVLLCRECTDYSTANWPCSTIQAIEKEFV
jgi:hypothetical protein